nr:MAG TPA: hypothetical protein [Caudoviricetes sp.]
MDVSVSPTRRGRISKKIQKIFEKGVDMGVHLWYTYHVKRGKQRKEPLERCRASGRKEKQCRTL